MAEPIVRMPGEGETVSDRAERTVQILFEHELADVTWTRYESGERGPDPHVHHEHVDSFYVLAGELEFVLGPDLTPKRAAAGTFVAVPADVVHTFANESDATALFLNFHTPSTGFAAHLRDERVPFDSFDPPAGGGRDPADAVVTLPGAGEPLGGERHVLGALEEISAFALAYGPGWEGVDPHTHDDHADSFFVLEGEVEFTAGDDIVTVGPGAFVAAPPGTRHGFRNPGPGRIVVLNVHTPDGGFAESMRRH